MPEIVTSSCIGDLLTICSELLHILQTLPQPNSMFDTLPTIHQSAIAVGAA